MPPQDFEEWPVLPKDVELDGYRKRLVVAYNGWRKEMTKHQQIWTKADNELKTLVTHHVFQQQQKLNTVKTQAENDFEHCKDQRREILRELCEEDHALSSISGDGPPSAIVLDQVVDRGGEEEGEEGGDKAAAVLAAGESRETPILVDWVDTDMKTEEESSDTPEADGGKSTKLEKRPRLHYSPYSSC